MISCMNSLVPTPLASTLSMPSIRYWGLNAISSGSPEKGAGSDSAASPMSGVSAATLSSPSEKANRSGAFRWASWLTRRATSSTTARTCTGG